jgi:hypothetical protein
MNESGEELLSNQGTIPVRPEPPPVSTINWSKLWPFLILALALALLFMSRRGISVLKPSPVSAAEIIRRNLEKFIIPNTIYHQKTKQYLNGSGQFNTYEIWEDQGGDRTYSLFYDEATYADGKKSVQGFNGQFHWDIDYATRTVHKQIYIYDNQQEQLPIGQRVDIAQQFDELLKNGILEAKEGKLDKREVYVVYDTRISPDKIWDILTFDKNNFQILQTEKYGEDKKLQELISFEIQEAIERTDENLKKYFTYQDPGSDFTVYQKNFYVSRADQEDYTYVSGPLPLPQNELPTPSTFPLISSPSASPRSPNPPVINITYPEEMQSIEFSKPSQTFCLVDVPAGGDTSGLSRKHNLNDSGWTPYAEEFTLCFEPKEGANRILLQYKNKYGDESGVYTRQFNFHRAAQISISLTGQLYRDENCNGVRDSGEGAVNTPTTVYIYQMPEFSVYGTTSSDNNGSFLFSAFIPETINLSLQFIPVSPPGYKANPNFQDPTITFSAANKSVTIERPQVPNENVSACQ